MKRTLSLLLSLCLLLCGCAAECAGGPSKDSSQLTQWLAETISTEEVGTVENTLTLTVNGAVVPVIWEDNRSVAELTEYAADDAIRIETHMYGGWEQVGSLGFAVPSSDTRLTAGSGDIMLYSGNQIVLFYGENTWEYTKLGHIELPESEITALLSSGAATITLVVQ